LPHSVEAVVHILSILLDTTYLAVSFFLLCNVSL